jgi:rod shape-determining protein MreD
MRRIGVLFLSQLLLWALVGQLNHALTTLQVYVFAPALFVAYATLRQPWPIGLTASLIGGLLCDATTPVAFGTHAMLFAAAHVAMFQFRERLPRDDMLGQVVIVLLVNLGLFLTFSMTQVVSAPAPAAIGVRLLVDLICSQMFVALVTPWFFALQTRAFVLAGIERENFA